MLTVQTKYNKECHARGRQLGLTIPAVVLLIWALPAWAEDGRRTSQSELVPGSWENWLDRWWVEPELEWDNDAGDGFDLSIDAEIGHMVTDRLGFWGRPAYRNDDEEQIEDWDFRFGIRYRFN